MRKSYGTKEYFTRLFHKEVRTLRKKLESYEIVLKSKDEASDNDICILSEDESEIGYNKNELECINKERYFITSHDYDILEENEEDYKEIRLPI